MPLRALHQAHPSAHLAIPARTHPPRHNTAHRLEHARHSPRHHAPGDRVREPVLDRDDVQGRAV